MYVTVPDHTLAQPGRHRPAIFQATRCQLSTLLGGGGGGLGLSGSTSSNLSTGSTVSVNNAGSSSGGLNLNNQTLLIFAAIALGVLLLFGLFRGKRK